MIISLNITATKDDTMEPKHPFTIELGDTVKRSEFHRRLGFLNDWRKTDTIRSVIEPRDPDIIKKNLGSKSLDEYKKDAWESIGMYTMKKIGESMERGKTLAVILDPDGTSAASFIFKNLDVKVLAEHGAEGIWRKTKSKVGARYVRIYSHS